MLMRPTNFFATPALQAPNDLGSGAPPPSALTPEEAQRRQAAARRLSTSLGQAVTVLLQSLAHRHLKLAELERMLLPALQHGQFMIGEANAGNSGFPVPVGLVLWAAVGPEIDKHITDNIDKPIRLKPAEWQSGQQLWIIEAVGPANVLQPMLARLNETTFQGRPVKFRARGKDGKVTVGTVPLGKAMVAAAPLTPAA